MRNDDTTLGSRRHERRSPGWIVSSAALAKARAVIIRSSPFAVVPRLASNPRASSSGDEAEALDMPNHATGIGCDRVFHRTTLTESNIDTYLEHQGDWVERSDRESDRRPFHDRFGQVFRGAGRALSDDELQRYFMLGYLRRGLGGPRDLRRHTSWVEAKWFEDASALMNRMAELFNAIGRKDPSPSHIMRQKDLEDARWISDEIERKRAELDGRSAPSAFSQSS